MKRVNFIRTIRPSMRTLVNIANGIVTNKTDTIEDRFTYYANIVEILIEEMREA